MMKLREGRPRKFIKSLRKKKTPGIISKCDSCSSWATVGNSLMPMSSIWGRELLMRKQPRALQLHEAATTRTKCWPCKRKNIKKIINHQEQENTHNCIVMVKGECDGIILCWKTCCQLPTRNMFEYMSVVQTDQVTVFTNMHVGICSSIKCIFT